MSQIVDFILHSDKHLLEFVRSYGAWVYGLLFAIVFAETGFVVTPFLPGDSLLFATGALCATGALEHAGGDRAAVRRGLHRQRGELRDRTDHRPARVRGDRSLGLSASSAEPRSPGARARLLREIRREGHRARAASCRSSARSCRSWQARPRCGPRRSCSTTSWAPRRGSCSASARAFSSATSRS